MRFVFETICDDFLVIFKLRPAKCALEIRGDTSRAACVKFFFRLECEGKQSISRSFSPKSRCKQFLFFFSRSGSRIFCFKKETWIVIRWSCPSGVTPSFQRISFYCQTLPIWLDIWKKKRIWCKMFLWSKISFQNLHETLKSKQKWVEGKQTKQTDKAFVS